jgi:hypothetical protein
MTDEFRQKLTAFAARVVDIAPKCGNEESTKMFLILPFLHVLGYDDRNPSEVCPEHSADFSEKYKNRVDFAILKNDLPVIAIECKCCGAPLKDERGQLRSYFNAAPTVKMGVLTDGLIYEFYADSDEPNMMDQTAFLTVNLRQVAKGKIEESVLDGLRGLQKAAFDPENIGAEAKRKLVFQNMVQQINALAEAPSESFARLLLQNAGLSHVRSKALAEYQEIIRGAFSEFINLRILRRLDLPSKESERSVLVQEPIAVEPVLPVKAEDKIVTTELELEVFARIKQRLAFLVRDEALFREIEHLGFRDYQGKFVVFYRRERKGRMFDMMEGENPRIRITFADGTEVTADKVMNLNLDKPLLASFQKRVEEDGRLPASTAVPA